MTRRTVERNRGATDTVAPRFDWGLLAVACREEKLRRAGSRWLGPLPRRHIDPGLLPNSFCRADGSHSLEEISSEISVCEAGDDHSTMGRLRSILVPSLMFSSQPNSLEMSVRAWRSSKLVSKHSHHDRSDEEERHHCSDEIHTSLEFHRCLQPNSVSSSLTDGPALRLFACIRLPVASTAPGGGAVVTEMIVSTKV